jgi:thymidylate synthase (FAD)
MRNLLKSLNASMQISEIEVNYINHCGSDLSVVNAARVSFHKISHEFTDKDHRLVNYLAKHKHHSPFNHAFITVRVKAPIFVARQLVKHKFMPWNEVSRRYVDDEPEFYMPEFRAKSENVKQGSSSNIVEEGWWSSADNWYSTTERMEEHIEECLTLYKDMLASGIAPEVARSVLPQNTMTEWYWSGTLGAFGDMLKLRLDPHAQKETREVAKKIDEIISPLFPSSLSAILNN